MLDPSNKDSNDLPLTIRAVFIIGPDKKLKLSLNYPASVGRNMDEIMRCVDALQLSAKHSVVSGGQHTACDGLYTCCDLDLHELVASCAGHLQSTALIYSLHSSILHAVTALIVHMTDTRHVAPSWWLHDELLCCDALTSIAV